MPHPAPPRPRAPRTRAPSPPPRPQARALFVRAALAFAGWGGFAVNDVSAFLGYFYTKGSFAMAYDDEVTALVTEGARILDAERRRTLYAQAFRLITERAYFLPLFTYVKTYGFSRQLDFTPWPDDNPRFYRARWK